MDDCPILCATCPMVPRGVTAALTGATVMTMDELRRSAPMFKQPENATPFVGSTRINTEVVASKVPHVDVGDTAIMLVGAGGKGYAKLKRVVRNCKGPVFTRFQRIFKFLRPRGRCGAMDNRHIVRLGQ